MDTNLYKYNNVPNGLPVVPPKNNAKKYVLVLLVLIVAGVAIFAFIKKDDLFNFVKKEEPTVVILSPAQQLDLEKRTLLSSSVIKFNLITKNVPITINKLPEVLKKFVDESGSDLKIEEVKYEKGSGGFVIGYVLKDIKMEDVERRFQIITLNNKFEMLKGLRAERFGFTEYKNTEYEIRVSYTLNEDSTVTVNINIINIQ